MIGEAGASTEPAVAAARARGLPLLTGRLVPDPAAVAALGGLPIFAFAGIADPEKFFATLRAAGLAIAATQRFADHHRFSAAEAADLIAKAEQSKLALVTTEKDHARMTGDPALAALARRTRTLPVTLEFDHADAIVDLLKIVWP